MGVEDVTDSQPALLNPLEDAPRVRTGVNHHPLLRLLAADDVTIGLSYPYGDGVDDQCWPPRGSALICVPDFDSSAKNVLGHSWPSPTSSESSNATTRASMARL